MPCSNSRKKYLNIYSFYLVTDQLKEIRLEISQLNHKTGPLELKNEDQD